MRKRRRAYTLVECLVMMVLVGATLGTISVTLHVLRRADIRLRASVEREQAFERFVDRWRDDMHMSRSAAFVVLEPASRSANRLRLTHSPDRTIDYSLSTGEIVRIVREGGEVRHRETFVLGLGDTARWTIDPERNQRLISLDLGTQLSDKALAVGHVGMFTFPPSAAVSTPVQVVTLPKVPE